MPCCNENLIHGTMKSIYESIPFKGSELEQQAYLQGCEFVRMMVIQKMKELFDDEWLTDGEIIDQLYEFIRK